MKRRIVFLTGGPLCPSDRFRIYAYLPALRAAGVPHTVRPMWTPRYPSLAISYPWSEMFWVKAACGAAQACGRLADLAAIGAGDVVVIQREALSWGPPWVERLLKRRGVKIVVDLDDAVHLPASFETEEAAERKMKRWRAIQSCASFMVYGNHFLQETSNPAGLPSAVIPSVVDTNIYLPRKSDAADAIRIGWVGTRNNIVFLEPIIPVLRQIEREFPGVSVDILCNQPAAVHLDLERARVLRWSDRDEPAVIASWDVGLMPLKEDDWCRSKCGMKLLQYLACGVAAVASPVGVNRDILAAGGGVEAGTPEEWLAQLRALCSDASLRRRLGEAGRVNAERSWSVGRWAGTFVDLCKKWMEM